MSNVTLPETNEMGRVVVSAKIESLSDVLLARHGVMPGSEVRSIDVEEALVDTGCISLGLPTEMIQQLGLNRVRTRTMQTTNGPREAGIYEPVRLTVQERDCVVEVYETPESCPVLIGQIPLEIMDFVVEPRTQRLIGNPKHGGEWINDMY